MAYAEGSPATPQARIEGAMSTLMSDGVEMEKRLDNVLSRVRGIANGLGVSQPPSNPSNEKLAAVEVGLPAIGSLQRRALRSLSDIGEVLGAIERIVEG